MEEKILVLAISKHDYPPVAGVLIREENGIYEIGHAASTSFLSAEHWELETITPP